MLRYAFRSLARTPVVTLVVVFSLGLGIGSNTAIFSLLHQIVLRSLPVPDPGELVLFNSPGEFKSGRQSMNNAGGSEYIFNHRTFRALEADSSGVAEVAAFRQGSANIATEASTVSGSVLMVSGDYFSALRIRPLMGRFLNRQDDVPGHGNPAVVLGYGYWQEKLGSDPQVVDRQIRVNGHSFTVVGVAPRGFTGLTLGDDPDVYVPLAFKPQMTPGWDGTDRLNDYWLYLFARLVPGTSREQAAAALNGAYRGLVEEQAATVTGRDEAFIERFRQSRLTLIDGRHGNSSFREGSRTPALILMAASILVLLIAMANAANLLLARSTQRRKELSIRMALGAERRHLMGLLLSEALLMALAGGAVGLLLARWTLSLLVSWIGSGEGAVYFLTTRLQWPVLLFALGLSAATGLLLGLYPAWEAARRDVSDTLREGVGKASAGRGSARVRKTLVGAQVTISVLLLVPTGLFLKSLVNLVRVDLGWPTEQLVTFSVSPTLNGYTQERTRSLFKRMEEELAALPGVSAVTAGLVPLISGSNWSSGLTVEDFGGGPDKDADSSLNEVGPGFFARMGIPLLAGREFGPEDDLGGPQVAVVNETFARHFFGEESPLGKRFAQSWGDNVELDIEIVGLVKDTNYSDVKQEKPRLFYLPWRQDDNLGYLTFYVRSGLPTGATISSLRQAMAGLDPDLPLENLQTMEAQIRDNIQADRIVLQLASVFALLATGLAMLGLYGVMSYSVAQRVREIGIRMALGAAGGRIRRMIFSEMLVILGLGVGTGIPLALGAARLAESQLFGVTAFDGPVLAGAIAALTLAALAAGYLPARRATRVDPVGSLRVE
jgi:predicted permease